MKKIRKALQIISGWVRCCSYCGDPRGWVDLYCDECWDRLLSLMQPKVTLMPSGHLCFSLFSWNKKSDKRIRNLVYALKGGGLHVANKKLAAYMAIEFSKNKIGVFKPVLVPAPAAKKGCDDHAKSLAIALSNVWQGELWCPLERAHRGPQKRKKRSQRCSIEFELNHTAINRSDLRARTLIFVDDIHTTGATARAAVKALEMFSKPMVWTLVRRPLLRSTRDDDS